MRRIVSVLLVFVVNHFTAVQHTEAASLKEELEQKGVTYAIVYTVDYFANTKGGLQRDDTYLTNLDLTLSLDTAKMGFWKSGEFFLYVLENSGGKKLTGSIVGDLQGVSNIESPRTVRLYELWYQHHLNEYFSVLAGFHDYNSEFNVTDYGGLYLNSSFGVEPDISLGARPSIFPLAAPGIRLKAAPVDAWEFLFAAYDGDPGDPDESEHVPRSDFDAEGGVFLAAEATHRFQLNDLPGSFKVGAWHNTGEFEHVVDESSRDGNEGFYLLVDQQVFKEADAQQGLGMFLQLGTNDPNVNEINWYAGGGVNYRGLIPGRDHDEAGIAIAHARVNEDLADTDERERVETVIEATYRAEIREFITLQPDVQYILNPGAATDVPDAVVVGVRMEISL